MGKLSTAWRRLWGIRPGELAPPERMLGRRRAMGEPTPGSHGRGWSARHRKLRALPTRSRRSS